MSKFKSAERPFSPKTKRGKRFLALRSKIVKAGTKLLSLDEINRELGRDRG